MSDKNNINGPIVEKNTSDGLSLRAMQAVNEPSDSLPNLRPLIFMLNVDCFEELFEWFSLADLLKFRQTCKRMKQVVNYYIELNYKELKKTIYTDEIVLMRSQDRFSDLKSFDLMKLIKHIHFSWQLTDLLADLEIKDIEHLLRQVESVTIEDEFHIKDIATTILNRCTNLKYLSILSNIDIGSEPHQLLERLEIMSSRSNINEELTNIQKFFDSNANIRHLKIEELVIQQGREFWLNSHIQLETLNVTFYGFEMEIMSYMLALFDLLNELYERRFYKHLVINFMKFQLRCPPHFPRGLKKVCCCRGSKVVSAFPLIQSLKELCIQSPRDIIEPTTEHFPNVTYIRFSYAQRLSEILPFIRYFPKLKVIIINDQNIDIQFDFNIDLFSLNKERKKLADACKVTVYIFEKDYLAFKWSKKTEFDLIELKRADSFEDYSRYPFIDC